MTEAPLTRCPSCGKESLARIIGGGGGLIFKGSGFYLTDYNKGSAPGVGVRKEEKKEGGKEGGKEEKKEEKKEKKKEEKPKGPTDTGPA